MNKKVAKKWIRTEADKKAVYEEGCYFDIQAGRRACDFIERFCVYTNGDPEIVGRPVTLLPWQRDFLMRLFGFKRKNGRRRFRAASVWLPKKVWPLPTLWVGANQEW